MVNQFRPPVRRVKNGYRLNIRDDEVALIRQLLGEMRALITADPGPGDRDDPVLQRLFPAAHPDDPEQEAEYQRLMRDELVESKLAGLDAVEAALDGTGPMNEYQLTSFMQATNSVRLVLGTMLGVTDEPDADDALEAEDSAEFHLYSYLSWLLDWTVRALSGA